MGQSNKSNPASSSFSRPSSQLPQKVPTIAPLSISSSLPISGTQKQEAQLLEANTDLSNPDTLRMAGDIFGVGTSSTSNKYTAQGLASGSSFDSGS
jgi:hypothetical protein